VAVEAAELRLVWPAELFAAEASALLDAGADDDSLAGLLAEAFFGGRGEQLLLETAVAHPQPDLVELDESVWGGVADTLRRMAHPRRATAALVQRLARDADRLPVHIPRSLFRERQRSVSGEVLSVEACTDRLAKLLGELVHLGYFEGAFGSTCSDSDDDSNVAGQRWLAERLDLHDIALWPLHAWADGSPVVGSVHRAWAEDVLFDVLEALDEVVARPRQRHWHSYHREWDYSGYSRTAGQAVYRWRVNELLDRSTLNLRLAVEGHDAGLLVQATDLSRQDLLVRTLGTPALSDRDDVAHAVQLFRSRAATREARRSAVVALAGVLERRRAHTKAVLRRRDEGALFQLANEFDLRHRDPAQRNDYDDAFLDWVFWWYLATIELTDRLLTRPADSRRRDPHPDPERQGDTSGRRS
jgi:hypothetical protein